MKIDINPPVAILGFGIEGQSALKFLQNRWITDITICDEKESVNIPEGIKARLGKTAFDHLSSYNTLFRSPGVHYRLPEILEAKDRGALVTSMTELTLEVARNRTTAVTGSNGKTTTTAMVEKILTAHYGEKLIVGGNDRRPVLEDVLKKEWPVLMEVSSFQFADIKMSPHISVIINITPNHMDWHENEADYVNAKANLIAHQSQEDWAVLNAANENSAKLATRAPGQIFWINQKKGPAWAVWEGGDLVTHFDGQSQAVLSKEDLIIKTHPDNLLAAVAVGLIHGVEPEYVQKTLVDFKGVEQRLEFVRELNGVKFYNDSACTTPESVDVALDQFPKGKLILLLGGSSKNADFSFMAHHMAKAGARAYLYGSEAERLETALIDEDATHLILHRDFTHDFEAILSHAYSFAEPGDNIVLSPACASFDMFKNSKERGNQFIKIINRL